jgi:glucokinase
VSQTLDPVILRGDRAITSKEDWLAHASMIGVDVGGTKIAAGVIDPEGRVLRRVTRPTPTDEIGQLEAAIVDAVRELSPYEPIAAIGLATAGLVDTQLGTVVYSPNIPAIRDWPLRDRISTALGLPVVVDNDANAAGWGEARFGAGRGCANLVCITLGTGIGGAIIADGHVVRGQDGLAGEVGHMIVARQGRLCACGGRGCWESYASGSALVTRAQELLRTSAKPSLLLDGTDDSSAIRVTGEGILGAAVQGDSIALASYRECGEWLGFGLAMLATILNPGSFVIVGGAAAAGELLLDSARTTMRESMLAGATSGTPDIRLGSLGADAGIIGAADQARTHLRSATGEAPLLRGAQPPVPCVIRDDLGDAGRCCADGSPSPDARARSAVSRSLSWT